MLEALSGSIRYLYNCFVICVILIEVNKTFSFYCPEAKEHNMVIALCTSLTQCVFFKVYGSIRQKLGASDYFQNINISHHQHCQITKNTKNRKL